MIIKFLETFQKLERYCYETKNLKKAQKNYNLHNLYSLLLIRNVKNGNIIGSIIGSYDDYSISCQIKKGKTNLPSKKDGGFKQLNVVVNNGDAKIEINK